GRDDHDRRAARAEPAGPDPVAGEGQARRARAGPLVAAAEDAGRAGPEELRKGDRPDAGAGPAGADGHAGLDHRRDGGGPPEGAERRRDDARAGRYDHPTGRARDRAADVATGPGSDEGDRSEPAAAARPDGEGDRGDQRLPHPAAEASAADEDDHRAL